MKVAILFLVPTLLWASVFSSDISAVYQAAAKEKKPIIIDFFGIWCPPCNELDETVFESTDFLKKAKAFKLLKVDADAESSWKIKDRYKIGGYPTVLFTDSKGNEIYRITGYRPPNEFLRVMELVLKSQGKPLEAACQSKTTDDLWRCAAICTEKKDDKCVLSSLKKLQGKLAPGTAKYEMARTLAVQHSATEDLKRDGYERLMTEFPASPLAFSWASSYFELFDGSAKLQPRKELVEKVLANYAKVIADGRREEMGVMETDLAQFRADLLEKVGKKEESQKAWKDAADLLEKFSLTLPKGVAARGFTLERISCLEQAGDVDSALKLAKEYAVKFPKEFTFHYVVANLLERQKKYGEALTSAKLAHGFSYGDNKIRVAMLLIRLNGALGDREAARLVYEVTTKEFNPAVELEVRTHRYLAKLQETFAKLPR